MKDDDDLLKWIERLSRDEKTSGLIAAIISLIGLVAFVATVAFCAHHKFP